MVELLATMGATAKELFEYNRDYYTFDQKQRLDREMLRLEMQIKRFDLFREDIRDLVELTTSKMEMYHMVGALMCEFCVLIYTEGAEIAWIAPAPPFIKALYALSLASAFNYILLAVWLSMHASVSAHSFGVRLLTRFVRLPIPGVRQVSALNARLTDFERQGAKEMLRVPFIGNAQDWQQMAPADLPKAPEERGEGDVRFKPAVQLKQGELHSQDLLGTGEVAINENDLVEAAARLPGHHVTLFRRIQAKWQCYDTYARVCMSLGAYHLLAGISYYLIIGTMQHYHSPSTGYALVAIFALTIVALGLLDIGKSMAFTVIALHVFGAIPLFLAAGSISIESPHAKYPYSPVIFFLVACWHEGLLHMAWPSEDGMSLPRRFRTVLFIDVFAVADEALKLDKGGKETKPRRVVDTTISADERAKQAVEADEALMKAEAAMRRWQAVPAGTSEAKSQGHEISRLRKQLLVSRRMLNGEAARLSGQEKLLDIDTRQWHDLTEEEKEDDPFAGCLLGPFKHSGEGGAEYFYDLEEREFVWHADDREVLTLEDLEELVRDADRDVKGVLGGTSDDDSMHDSADESGDSSESDSDGGPKRKKQHTKAPDAVIPTSKPQRLPWKAVNGTTRVLEIAWLLVGVLNAVEKNMEEDYRFDQYVAAEEGRRLGVQWQFEELPVAWPRRSYFRPGVMSCPAGGAGELLLGGPDGVHRAVGSETEARWLEALPGPGLSSRAAVLCGPRQGLAVGGGAVAQCLLGEATSRGVALWPLGGDRQGPNSVLLRVEGQPWQALAGAIVRCEAAAGLLVDGNASEGPHASESRWCLLLVGWDGSQLPVAAVPLTGDSTSLPAPTETISPIFDAPLAARHLAPSEDDVVATLHVEPVRGRLWAGLASGELQAWELLGDEPRSLGRWRTPWGSQSSKTDVHLTSAVCEDGEALFVASRGSLSGPHLWRSLLPRKLL